MRKNLILKIKYRINAILLIIFVLLFFCIIFSNNIKAQDKNLLIEIRDSNTGYIINEINENEYFKVSVRDPDDILSSTPYLINVILFFNNVEYLISEQSYNADIELKAPNVDQNTYFSINASKSGYNSYETDILIKNKPKLKIIPDKYTVDADEIFSLTVKDENDKPLSGVTVFITNYREQKSKTNSNGVAWLKAPEDTNTIRITANKTGYITDSIYIKINIEPSFFDILFQNKLFPIIIALIVLIVIIIFVNRRENKSVDKRAKQISKKRLIDKYYNESVDGREEIISTSSIRENVRVKPDENPKIEEIRITRYNKEKEVIPVITEEEKTGEIADKKRIQRKDYDWFEGTDEMRYEINKLTGDVDEEGIDKWYEGDDNFKDKISGKVKKKDKKNNN